jgi:hypothetical protein
MKAYNELDNLSARCRKVVSALEDLGVATDRRIKEHLNLPDMNNVRPRVTELIKLGIVIEDGEDICEETNRSVRLIRLAKPMTNQLEMF